MANRRAYKDELFETSHLIILISYTVLAAILIAESLLMGWEKWALLIIFFGVILSWFLHIAHKGTDYQRMWVYTLLTMGSFFFYGIHETSTFDLAVVISAIMMLYTITAVKYFITLCQITYYLTMAYALVQMILNDFQFDSLTISRTAMHFVMVTLVGFFARKIIERWCQVLEKSNDEIASLTDSTKRLNDFMANVSHELRTPANAVIGLSEICIDKESNEEIKKDMISVREAGRRVAEQVSDILDYSEIDSNKLVVNNDDYILSSVLFDIVSEIRPYRRPEVELIIDVDPFVPAVMNSDVAKIKKIIKLLIVNSLKFTSEGGVYVRITSVKEDYGVNLEIEVTDTGIGMSSDELERAFDKFYQADSGRSRMSGGLGLGLGIVSGFVSSLGGFITATSSVDSGTSVHISLPQKVTDPSECMSVKNKQDICVGGFLHFEKFSNPNVREYYNIMLRNIVNGLGIQMHRVDNTEDLERLLDSVNLTHLFVAEEEYNSAKELIDSISGKILVVVICDEKFKISEHSRVKVSEKPFYCFPVVNYLNMSLDSEDKGNAHLICKGVRALVVDDEPMNLSVAKSILKRYEMVVSTAESGYEALEMCDKYEYDIVFMDHMMSGMDGIETMKKLRSANNKLFIEAPIIALTANAMSSAKQMFLNEGFDGFVSKPIEKEELERVLKIVLPRKRISYIYDNDSKKAQGGNADSINNDKNTVVNAGGIGKKMNNAGIENKTESENKNFDTSKAYADEYLDKLASLGIDVEKGLGFCQDDSEFYKELLKQYVEEAEDKRKAMSKFFEVKDIENYEIYVHALKSTSKMIGAMDLSEDAKKLEEAAKEKNYGYIREHHPDVMEDYDNLTNQIIETVFNSSLNLNKDNDDEEILEFFPEGENEDIMEFEPVNEE